MPAFEVYCEQTLQGGGWIVIQNRFDGSVDFYRNWTDYKEGFGRLDGEFWLGLDKINLLTSRKARKLLVHLEDFSGNKKFALYSEFAIGSESEQYVLSTVGGHSGTLVDSFVNHRGNKFTTKDVDNDKNSKNCASWFHGAWWYTPGCYTRYGRFKFWCLF
ncbi:ryncolin-1-like [Culex pipiens pallens]|uniref:ryncolin-1-like n=1 Tax=Culex pipiens pallens TaxID=42434 RepID=UPI0022AA5ACC|nr:ryncolin-1-like [Culex pipiens pallens]